MGENDQEVVNRPKKRFGYAWIALGASSLLSSSTFTPIPALR